MLLPIISVYKSFIPFLTNLNLVLYGWQMLQITCDWIMLLENMHNIHHDISIRNILWSPSLSKWMSGLPGIVLMDLQGWYCLKHINQAWLNKIRLALLSLHALVSGPTSVSAVITQIAKILWPTWGPPGSCRPQMGPMLAPETLLSGQW